MSGAELALLMPALEGAGVAGTAAASAAPIGLGSLGAGLGVAAPLVGASGLGALAEGAAMPAAAALSPGFSASPGLLGSMGSMAGGIGNMANKMGGIKMGLGLLEPDKPMQIPPMQRPQQQQAPSLLSLLSQNSLSGVPAANSKSNFAIQARQMGLSPEELMKRMQGRMV